MNVYIVIANWGSQDQVEGCYKNKSKAEDRLEEVKLYAEWADIQEHDLID